MQASQDWVALRGLQAVETCCVDRTEKPCGFALQSTGKKKAARRRPCVSGYAITSSPCASPSQALLPV